MKSRWIFLCTMFFGTFCGAEDSRSALQPAASLDADRSALVWLAGKQNEDGSWGVSNQVALTSLSTLAFLARGETTASERYGETLIRALRFLHRRTSADEPLADEDSVLLVWCLAEAYGLTRIPVLGDLLAKRAPAMVEADQPTPWHVLATYSLFRSGMIPELGPPALLGFAEKYPPLKDSLLDQATRLYLAVHFGQTNQLDSARADLQRLSPARWKQDAHPLQCALLLSLAFFQIGREDWSAWDQTFYASLLKQQLIEGEVGWWTLESLGIESASEFPQWSRPEADIGTTALLLMTFPPVRHLPTFIQQPFP